MIKRNWKRNLSFSLGILIFLLLIMLIGNSSSYFINEKATKAPIGITPSPTPQYINQELSQLRDNGRPYGIFVSGNYAYLACRDYGMSGNYSSAYTFAAAAAEVESVGLPREFAEALRTGKG